MRRPTRAGIYVTVAVPISAYAGVSVRMVTRVDTKEICVVVELMHREVDLTVPLVVADEPEDVAADWQAWGRALNLPLLVIEQDGTIRSPVARIGALAVASTKARRRTSFLIGRRGRFLRRRKVGRPGPIERLVGREIIAPE